MRNLGLTSLERAAARCLLEGWSAGKTAEQLGVTKAAVKDRSRRLYIKTGQDGQVGLVTFLLRNPWALAQVMECAYEG